MPLFDSVAVHAAASAGAGSGSIDATSTAVVVKATAKTAPTIFRIIKAVSPPHMKKHFP